MFFYVIRFVYLNDIVQYESWKLACGCWTSGTISRLVALIWKSLNIMRRENWRERVKKCWIIVFFHQLYRNIQHKIMATVCSHERLNQSHLLLIRRCAAAADCWLGCSFFSSSLHRLSVSLLKACKKTSHPSCLLLISPLNRQHIPGQKKSNTSFLNRGRRSSSICILPPFARKKHGFLYNCTKKQGTRFSLHV